MTKVIKAIRTSEGDHQYDYESLANIPVVLGEPMYIKYAVLATSAVVDNGITLELDLSEYLPDDGNIYFVTLNITGKPDSSNEKYFIRANLATELEPNVLTGFFRNAEMYACVSIAVGLDRKIKVVPTTSANYRGELSITAIRYQKVNAIKLD